MNIISLRRSNLKQKIAPIIEWQKDIQRTPKETVEHLQQEIKDWDPERMLVLCWRDNEVQYITASKERNYRNADIFWDVSGWLELWRNDQEEK